MKEVVFIGDSLEQIRTFPEPVRQDLGYQLDSVQRGFEPIDWKPMKSIGQGVKEIRVKDMTGAYRVIYIAKLKDAIYVLHAFQKKTEKTRNSDRNLAAERLKELLSR